MSKKIIIIFAMIVAGCTNIKKKQMDAIELKSGKTVKCQALSREEHAHMLEHAKQKKEVFVKEGITVVELSNKQILVESNGYYTLYFSLNDLKAVLNDSHEVESFEILLNKNPYGENFPTHANELIRELFKDLNLPEAHIDRTSLMVMDQKINSMGKGGADFIQNHFIHFVAVIGASLRQQYDAKWKMELAADGQTWNPYMEIRKHEVEFFSYLYEDVFINPKTDNFLTELFDTMTAIIQNNLQ